MAHDIAEEASIGALPFQDAQWLRSGKRVMSQTWTSNRAATTAPTPWRSIGREPPASTVALSSAVDFLFLASTAISSASTLCQRLAASLWKASSASERLSWRWPVPIRSKRS